jgi:hypothetical protein
MRLLRTAFWLGVTICYLPNPPAHVATHDRSAASRQEPIACDRRRRLTFAIAPSHGTLTRSDLAIPWRGPIPLQRLHAHTGAVLSCQQ